MVIEELQRRGFETVQESGWRIIQEGWRGDGSAFPWVDGVAFAQRAIVMAHTDRAAARRCAAWVFFDRSLIDAASALYHLTGVSVLASLDKADRYHRQVFLAPPWLEIYVNDPERRHSLEEAVTEYERLEKIYLSLGYNVKVSPKASVTERADLILNVLQAQKQVPLLSDRAQ